MKMRIRVRDVVGDEICSGALAGRDALIKILQHLNSETSEAQPLFLDFDRIALATVSFLRESVIALRDFLRNRQSNYYLVLANANEAVKEELGEFLLLRNDALLICQIGVNDAVTDCGVLGRLDPKQQFVFDFVRQRGEADAALLQKDSGAREGVKQTAWNNRLSALAAAGLVVEVQQGKHKRYRPVLTGEYESGC